MKESLNGSGVEYLLLNMTFISTPKGMEVL